MELVQFGDTEIDMSKFQTHFDQLKNRKAGAKDKTPLEEEFERSPAFRWLQRNAMQYGFTLSYPRGNRHGIAYEPWHWCWHAKTSPS